MPQQHEIDQSGHRTGQANAEFQRTQEATRLAALRRYEILDTPSDDVFENLTNVTTHVFSVPYASISFADEARVWLKSVRGLEPGRSLPREFAFCTYVIESDRVMVVPDTTADPRFASLPRVLEYPKTRFYAGAPLITSDGYRIGCLDIADYVPRAFPQAQRETLRKLARTVMVQVELRLEMLRARRLQREHASIIEASPLGIASFDLKGRVRSWSPAAERILGWRATDILGLRLPLASADEERDFAGVLEKVERGVSVADFHIHYSRRDGSPIEIRLFAAPTFGPDGSVDGFVGIAEDLNEWKRSEQRLRLLESVVSSSQDAVAIVTAEPSDAPTYVYVNDAYTRVTGYDAAEVLGRPPVLRGPRTAREDAEALAAARGRKEFATREILFYRKGGEPFWCEVRLSPVVEPDGRSEYTVVQLRDVTARRAANELEQGRARVLESIAADADLHRTFEELVATAAAAHLETTAVVSLRRGNRLYFAAGAGPAKKGLAKLAAGSPIAADGGSCGAAAFSNTQILVEDVRSDPRWSKCHKLTHDLRIRSSWSTPIRSSAGDVLGTFEMFGHENVRLQETDLRLADEFAQLAAIAIERYHDRERLRHSALHDPLTGLANRVAFEKALYAAIAQAREKHSKVALGMVDLDRFKVVNESLGHAVGDQLLREVAARMGRAVRGQDTLARVGGDEFVLLMTDLDSREAAATLARNVLQALVPSFSGGGQEVFIRASMGISVYPDDATEPHQVLALCDGAMYAAKGQGRDVAFHESSENRDGVARITLETYLNHALENQEFELWFQPEVELRTRQVCGAEALLRWNHPMLGNMLPDAFVRAAEETGLIVPIGAWALRESCRFGKRWQDAGLDRFVSVNVSARQFEQHDFIGTVTDALEQTGLEPRRLHLELTEGLVMRSPETTAGLLRDLKAVGVKIVIDDFGTGYSNLSYLKRFPLDMLKIDRVFVKDVGDPEASNDEAIVRAIVGVADALDLGVVAEGVENEEQVAFLRAIGVDLAQGYLFSPALVAEKALRWSRKSVAR